MEEMIYTITLADGTRLINLTLNGNNFVSNDVIDPNIFFDNCSPVVINNGEIEDTHENMELIHVSTINEKSCFALRDITVAELEKIKMQSDIEYIAMMTGVEL